MNYFLMIFAVLFLMLVGGLYYANQKINPQTPQECAKAGGQVFLKPGGKGFGCELPKEWWRF